MNVGFIGLGIMGLSMARNILKAGHKVTVYNRTTTRAGILGQEGADVAATPADVAKRSEVVITCVTDTPDVEQVVLGPQGIAEGGRSGLIVVDMSTISPDATRKMATALEAKGMEMLDAPVTGGDVGAMKGTLSIMVGGKPDVLAKVKPVLDTMGKSVIHVGGHGAGQTVKLCNQILCALNMIGLCEAISMCRKAGIDAEKMLAVTSQGAGGSWALSNLGPKILAGDFQPAFMIQLIQKDLRLVRELAAAVTAPMNGTPLAQELFSKVEQLGGARLGTQGMYLAYDPAAKK